jgi:hypothetical protein
MSDQAALEKQASKAHKDQDEKQTEDMQPPGSVIGALLAKALRPQVEVIRDDQ